MSMGLTTKTQMDKQDHRNYWERENNCTNITTGKKMKVDPHNTQWNCRRVCLVQILQHNSSSSSSSYCVKSLLPLHSPTCLRCAVHLTPYNLRSLLRVEVLHELVPLVDDGDKFLQQQLLLSLLSFRLLPVYNTRHRRKETQSLCLLPVYNTRHKLKDTSSPVFFQSTANDTDAK